MVRQVVFRGCYTREMPRVRPLWSNDFDILRLPNLSSLVLSNFHVRSPSSIISLVCTHKAVAALDLDGVLVGREHPSRVTSIPDDLTPQDLALRKLSLRICGSDHRHPLQHKALAEGLARTHCLSRLTSMKLSLEPTACLAWGPFLPPALRDLTVSIENVCLGTDMSDPRCTCSSLTVREPC